ncbi:MAG TPA: DUF5667 domain-containing protein [Candidatus Peribacteraceae bacterium]|nr:DUF5667 domain-containing protein [Candidatus Peribacteraceae bacterium]
MDKKLREFFRQAADIHMTEDESLRVRGMVAEKMEKNAVRASDSSCLTGTMDDITPAFADSAKSIRLTEKEAMEAQKRLHAFMESHPVNMAKAVQKRERAQGGWSFFSLRFGSVLAAVVVLIGAGSGISYAAESALPGDPLYGVKVHVNEAVQAGLAFSPAAKARVNAQIADERLHEAEQLAARGRLTTDASTSLVAAFQTHLDDAHQAIADVAAAGKAQDAATIDDEVAHALQNHAAVLNSLAAADSGSDVHSEIAVILQNVEDATQKTVAFHKTLDGNGQIAMKIAVPFTSNNPDVPHNTDTENAPLMMRVDINQQTEEHHETSSSDEKGNSEHTEMHTFADTHVNVSNTVQGLMMLKTGSGAASSGSGTSSGASSSNGVSVHIENGGSAQVDTQSDSTTNNNVQINTNTTTNVTNEVHIEQSNQ